MLRKLLGLISDASVYGASSMIGQLVGFFLLPLYTQYLSPSDYGIIAMAGIIIMLFTPMANLGMTNAIFRRYSKCKKESERRDVFSTGLTSVALMSVLLGLVGLQVAEPITKLFVGDIAYIKLTQMTLITAVITTINQIPVVVLRADRRVKTAALVNIICLLTTILITIWFVVFKKWGISGVILANLISSVLSFLAYFAIVFKTFRLKPNFQAWKSMLSYGLPYLPHRIQALGLAQFGQYMVANMIGLDEAGLYSIALRIVMPITFVVGAIQQAWVPYKFQIHAQDESPADFFRTAITYYVAGISYLWVGVSLWGPEIVRLMTAESFHRATLFVPAVALISFSQGLFFMLGTGFGLTDDTRQLPLVSLAGLIVVVGGAFLLIPWLGALGAALTTVFGWLTMAVLIYMIAQRCFRVSYDWTSLVSFFVFSSVCVLFSCIIQNMPIGLRLTFAIGLSVLYPVVLFAVLYRSHVERERMSILWTKLRFGWRD